MFFNAGGSILCYRHFPSRPTIFPEQREDEFENENLEEEDSLDDYHYEEVFAHIRKETYAKSSLS